MGLQGSRRVPVHYQPWCTVPEDAAACSADNDPNRRSRQLLLMLDDKTAMAMMTAKVTRAHV